MSYLQKFQISDIPARNDKSKFSGIYAIVQAQSGRIYIGSSVSVLSRLSMHRSSLRRDCHHNVFLQRAWNKYGEEAFEFVILEKCSREKLFEREKSLVFEYSKTNAGVFNIGEVMETSFGRVQSPETLAKLSAIRLGRKLPPMIFTDSHREALSIAGKERFKNGRPQSEIDSAKYPITIDGIWFDSTRAAAVGLGVHHSTITELKRRHGVVGIRGAVINRIPLAA